MIDQVLSRSLALLLLALSCAGAVARHPWDCIGLGGDEGNYCRALFHNDKSFCDNISHEGMKFTCHARTRFNKNICAVIDDKKDRNYCLQIVSKEIKIRNEYAIRTVKEIPHEDRISSAWQYGR